MSQLLTLTLTDESHVKHEVDCERGLHDEHQSQQTLVITENGEYLEEPNTIQYQDLVRLDLTLISLLHCLPEKAIRLWWS